VWDTLSADACPIEMVQTANGQLSGYYNLDFETIRLTIESGYEGDDEIRAVQLQDGIPAGARRRWTARWRRSVRGWRRRSQRLTAPVRSRANWRVSALGGAPRR